MFEYLKKPILITTATVTLFLTACADVIRNPLDPNTLDVIAGANIEATVGENKTITGYAPGATDFYWDKKASDGTTSRDYETLSATINYALRGVYTRTLHGSNSDDHKTDTALSKIRSQHASGIERTVGDFTEAVKGSSSMNDWNTTYKSAVWASLTQETKDIISLYELDLGGAVTGGITVKGDAVNGYKIIYGYDNFAESITIADADATTIADKFNEP